jgi:hypothetical protein
MHEKQRCPRCGNEVPAQHYGRPRIYCSDDCCDAYRAEERRRGVALVRQLREREEQAQERRRA